MMFVAWPVCEAFAMSFTGFSASHCGTRDRDEEERDREADERRAYRFQKSNSSVRSSNAIVTGMNPTTDSTVATGTLGRAR